MKYCVHCGKELLDEAVVCPGCGCRPDAASPAAEKRDDTLAMVVKVFLILGCIAEGAFLLPLAWCIPITVSIFRKLKAGQPVGTGMKLCTLLLVSRVAGICLLCAEDL